MRPEGPGCRTRDAPWCWRRQRPGHGSSGIGLCWGAGEAWKGKQPAAPTPPSQGPGEETAAPRPASQRAGLITAGVGGRPLWETPERMRRFVQRKAANLIPAPPAPSLLSLGEVIHIYELIIPANHPTSHIRTNSHGSGSYIVIRCFLCHRRSPPKDDRGRPGAEYGDGGGVREGLGPEEQASEPSTLSSPEG